MFQKCQDCGTDFEITRKHLDFYDSVSPVFGGTKCALPPPVSCPPCRQQRRNSWRNERVLYKRKCGLCKKSMISLFPEDSPYVVYCNRCYWADTWSPHEGFAYDFSKPFGEQFDRLLKVSPILGTIHVNAENSDWCNRVYDSRNNYLSVIVLFGSENVTHGYYSISCKDICDTAMCQYAELSYELVDGEKCYNCYFSTRMRNCSACWFSQDCTGCRNCFQCKNLRQKEYCIRNAQVTKEEYEKYMKSIHTGSFAAVERLRKESDKFFLTLPNRAALVIDCENCTGANIYHCKDCDETFTFYESEKMQFCSFGEKSHDCMDCYGQGAGEFCYECQGFLSSNQNIFCNDCAGNANIAYSHQLNANSSECFGCVGLKKAKYRILNKQYTQKEYEALMPKIIAHMQSTGEWGRWLLPALSPHGYNETVAQEYFPLTKDEAVKKGFRWRDKDPADYQPASVEIPDDISDVRDTLTSATLACNDCGKNYRIIAQELTFYRQHALPVPRKCPDCRHLARILRRPPPRLWEWTCAHCNKSTLSSYAPERPEIIYCETCYLQTVY